MKDNLVGMIFANTAKAFDYFKFTLLTWIFLSFKTLSEAVHGVKGSIMVLQLCGCLHSLKIGDLILLQRNVEP